MTSPETTFHVDFVCTGNICRSPMAEAMLIDAAAASPSLSAGLTVTSCGLGDWHVGHPADPRTVAELARHGIDGSDLRASQVGPFDLGADLLVAMDSRHRSSLIRRGAPKQRVRLLRSFDPAAPLDAPVPDPYHGDAADFATTYRLIAAALPGLLDWLSRRVR